MTKILKKSLACLLAFVLCFTAIASCLAVSAEKPVTSIFYDVMELDNDNKEWQLCPGETVRGYVQVNGIKAGTTVGITLELPKHAEITKINPFGAATGSEISRYYDAEEGLLTIVFKAKTDGNWNHLIYFNVTDATPKGVFYYDCTVDAAIKSSDSDDDHYINTVQRHFEVKSHEAAEAVIENEVEATCGSAGSYDEVVYCKWGDNEEISRNTVTVDALGHAWDAGVANPDATCESEGTMLYTCTRCPETKTEAISAKGHTEVAYEDVAATCTTVGYTGGSYCDVCKADIKARTEVPVTDHNYVDGTCDVCGAKDPNAGPTEDKNLVFAGASVGFGVSSLELNFRMNNKTVLSNYTNIKLVIFPQKYDTEEYNLVTDIQPIVVPYDKFAGTGTFRTYAYADIQLYELGLTIGYKLTGTNSEGVDVESPLYTTSAASYLRGVVPANDFMATLIADTLKVGQSAMENASANYTDSQLYKDAKATIIGDYDLSAATKEVDLEGCNKIDDYQAKDAAWGKDSGTHKVARSVVIAKAPYISYRIRGASSIDPAKFSATVTYTRTTGKGTTETYNKTFTGTEHPEKIYKNGSFFMFQFDEIGLGDSDKEISIVVTYDGSVVFTDNYSVESYLSNQGAFSDSIKDLTNKLINLGNSFRANMNS